MSACSHKIPKQTLLVLLFDLLDAIFQCYACKSFVSVVYILHISKLLAISGWNGCNFHPCCTQVCHCAVLPARVLGRGHWRCVCRQHRCAWPPTAWVCMHRWISSYLQHLSCSKKLNT